MAIELTADIMNAAPPLQPATGGWKTRANETREQVGQLFSRKVTGAKEWLNSPAGHRTKAVGALALAAICGVAAASTGTAAVVAFSYGVVSATLYMAGPSALSFLLALSKGAVAYATAQWAKNWFNTAKDEKAAADAAAKPLPAVVLHELPAPSFTVEERDAP